MIIWKNHSSLIAGTTLRDQNQPEYNNMALHCGGDLSAIIENRRQLGKHIHLPLDRFVFANQTHSDHIAKISEKDAGCGAFSTQNAIMDCDALYTREINLLLGVFTADCVPILLYDPMEKLICAIHSGWMGTVKQITAKTLHTLIHEEGCNPKHLHAYIGPAIAAHSFEVGMEVVEKLRALPFDVSPFIRFKNDEKALVDNKGLNQEMLLRGGVLKENITIDKNDTFAKNESFFSYRRDHQCGRHLSFIVQKG